MPRLGEFLGYLLLFYSMDRNEPPHVHASKGKRQVKFWLNPTDCPVAYNKRVNSRDISKLQAHVVENRNLFLEKWREHFRT